MSKRILILGAGVMQGVAIRSARSRGWETIVLDGNPDAPCRMLADRFEPIDLKDVSTIVSFAQSLQRDGGLDGVFTAATDFSVPVAAVAQSCGLPGHSLDSAVKASDKLAMRACFADAGLPSPRCIGVDTGNVARVDQLLADAAITLPVVVKPVDNMGARGCVRVDTRSSLASACADAISYSRSGRAIVEQYMDGPEFSLEALVFDGEFHMTGFADRHIRFPPYFVEMGHTIPSECSGDDRERIVSVFRLGAEALGLSHGVAKGDIKLTERGPMIGEIAARLSGGYMSGWTFPYSSGIDLTAAALSLAVGERPGSLEPGGIRVCAERAWISIPGTVASVHGLDIARGMPGVCDVFPRAGEGDSVSFPRNNVEKCGNCLAVATDRHEASRYAEQACAAVFLRLQAPDSRTAEFLNDTRPGFPPSAFEGIPPISETGTVNTVFDGYGSVPVPGSLSAFLDTALDWQQRTLRQCIARSLAIEPGLMDKLAGTDKKNSIRYWNALLRGGIQGIVYIYDCDT